MTELDTEALESFKTTDEVVFIGYISPGHDAARRNFEAVAEEFREEFTFGLISDEKLVQAQNSASPTVVCSVVEDGETKTFNSPSDIEPLRNFVKDASRRIIGELLPVDYAQQRVFDVSYFMSRVSSSWWF